jgi:acyl-CoA synthetase (AMP-forming)/AMP-acid ligase II
MTAPACPALPLQPVFTGISDQIAIHGRFRAQQLAFIEGTRQLTWSEYNSAANRIANAMIALGVTPGARIAVVVSNSLWAHELLLGTWRAGAVFVPLSPLLSHEALAKMIQDCDASVLFASDDYATSARAAAGGRRMFTQRQFEEHIRPASDAAPAITIAPLDLAVIIYSSGTTGTPKGIAHSHESRLKFGAYFAAEFRFHCHAKALSCIPIHSNGAWLSWLPAKWIGATTVILPRFSADDYLRAVAEHAPTHGFAVPTMAAAILQHPRIEAIGLNCFEALITAGSAMPAGIKQEMQRLSDNALFELWGLTEGVATLIDPIEMQRRPHSVGRAMLGCDIRLIGPDDGDVTHSGTGEIVGRSAAMMSGYWNRPDANAAVLWHDAHGTAFIRTGDIGAFDSDGFLILRGRKKDMIVSGGLNVYPIDIETCLLNHEDVLDAAVVGVEHEKWGEAPVAMVRLKPGARTDAITLQGWVNERLAKHQRVHALCIRSQDFPRNTLGKVLKNQLAEEYCSSLHASQNR